MPNQTQSRVTIKLDSAQDTEYNEDLNKATRAEECSFTKAVELSAPVRAAAPGASLNVPYTVRLQVGHAISGSAVPKLGTHDGATCTRPPPTSQCAVRCIHSGLAASYS